MREGINPTSSGVGRVARHSQTRPSERAGEAPASSAWLGQRTVFGLHRPAESASSSSPGVSTAPPAAAGAPSEGLADD